MCLSSRLQFIAAYEVSGPASTGTVLVFHYVPLQAFCVSCGLPFNETRRLGSAAADRPETSCKVDHKFWPLRCWEYIPIYLDFSYWLTLKWHIQYKDLVILHSYFIGAHWCPSGTRDHGISSHGIDLILPEYSSFSTRRVNTWKLDDAMNMVIITLFNDLTCSAPSTHIFLDSIRNYFCWPDDLI